MMPMALYSGITLGEAQGTEWNAEDIAWVSHVQDKCLPSHQQGHRSTFEAFPSRLWPYFFPLTTLPWFPPILYVTHSPLG